MRTGLRTQSELSAELFFTEKQPPPVLTRSARLHCVSSLRYEGLYASPGGPFWGRLVGRSVSTTALASDSGASHMAARQLAACANELTNRNDVRNRAYRG